MQQTKFWHELTEQQRHFLNLLASGEEANIELAKQLLLSLLREQNGEDYLADIDFLDEIPESTEKEKLIDSFEKDQRDFFANIGLPSVLSGFCTGLIVKHLPFKFLSDNINNFRCSRGHKWQGNTKSNKYIHYPEFKISDIFVFKNRIDVGRIRQLLAEFERFLSYPFGYKGKIIFTVSLAKKNDPVAINAASILCSDLAEIDPATTFRFLERDGIFSERRLEHNKALKILEKIPQQKNWLMDKGDIRIALLNGFEPIPNPDYLVLQNTCFYLRKGSNGATNPEDNTMNILAVSPEWKERNLTYKFID